MPDRDYPQPYICCGCTCWVCMNGHQENYSHTKECNDRMEVVLSQWEMEYYKTKYTPQTEGE